MATGIDTQTRLCAVIGNPVGHSLSPAIHNAAFEALGLNYAYLAFQVEDLAGCLTGMRALPTFRGLSVTIPHKVPIMEHLDEIVPMARHVGCVNTVTNENGTLIGSVTDGTGTLRAFREAGVTLKDKRILFIGTGGAVRAVAFAMAEEANAARVTILGRTPAHVQTLVADLRANTNANIGDGDLNSELPEAMVNHDIIIQGTPLGMYPERTGQTPVPPAMLEPRHVVFDMVYRPLRPQLIEDAEAVGCKTILGLEMLVNQAVLQFETWTGEEAPQAVMREALLAQLTGLSK